MSSVLNIFWQSDTLWRLMYGGVPNALYFFLYFLILEVNKCPSPLFQVILLACVLPVEDRALISVTPTYSR